MEEKIIVKRPLKSPVLAAILSIFFPGTGALYNAEYLKGIIYIVIFAGLVSMQDHAHGQPFLALILGGFYIFQIIDTIHTVNRINRKALSSEEAEEKGEEFPQVVKAGSVFWGVVLIAIGAILLLGNFDVINYDRIFDFWPVVVIVIGLKLVIDYFSKKQ